MAAAASSASAAPGSLDPTFGHNGLSTIDFGPGPSSASDVGVESDGKVVAIGVETSRGGGTAIVRYNRDGSLDPTFGDSGKVMHQQQLSDATTLLVQPDGKILVGGNSGLVRLNSDGSIDPNFTYDPQFMRPTAIGLQANGKIVITGFDPVTGHPNPVGRLNADGTPDATFSGDGKAAIDFAGSGAAIDTTPDGKLVVAGFNSGSSFGFGVERFNTDGSPDTSFSGDGVQVTAGVGSPADLAVQPDGKIVAVGGAIVRYDTNGSLDTSFSGDGIQRNTALPVAQSIQLAGTKILVGGLSTDQHTVVTARYTADGSPDLTYGAAGTHEARFGATDASSAMTARVQADGSAVAAGDDVPSNNTRTFAVERVASSGGPDTAFSSDGYVETTFGGFDEARAVAVQPDGSVLVAGTAHAGAPSFGIPDSGLAEVVRYHPDGSLDPKFGNGGIAALSTNASSNPISEQPAAIAVQPDGRILIAGNGNDIYRLNSNGSPDSTFGVNGVAVAVDNRASGGFVFSVSLRSITLQRDGKIVVGGAAHGAFAVARVNADGTRDTSFGTNGVQAGAFGDPGFGGSANAVTVQTDGKIVATGSPSSDSEIATTRLTAAGALDPSFGSNGKVTTPVTYPLPGGGSQASPAVGRAIGVQRDGKIVVGGSGLYEVNRGPGAVVRYNPDGTLDSSFGSDGQTRLITADIVGLGMTADDKIIVGGSTVPASTGAGSTPDFAATRLLADGAFDPSFGTDGTATSDLTADDEADAMWLDPSGNVLLAGSVTNASGDLAIIRYLGSGTTITSDNTAPTITITSPTSGQHFAEGAAVNSAFACSDESGGSGVASCSGPTTVDTSTAGFHTLTVVAIDQAGNRATKSVDYIVDAPASGGGDDGSSGGGSSAGNGGQNDGTGQPGSGQPGGGQAPISAPLPQPSPAPSPSTPTMPSPSTTAPTPPKLSGSPATTTAGTVTLGLTCSAATTCRGQVKLVATTQSHKKTKTITVGLTSYTIAGGTTKKLTIKLNSTGRKLLKSRHERLAVSLQITPSGAKQPASTHKLTLHAKKPTTKKAHGGSH